MILSKFKIHVSMFFHVVAVSLLSIFGGDRARGGGYTIWNDKPFAGTHRNKQLFTLLQTPKDNVELPTNLTNQSSQRKSKCSS